MTREELFEAWAPASGTWSNWVKPALFAQWPRALPPDVPSSPPDLSWVPRAGEHFALVVDLPGASSVHFGIALAAAGYRPVPLFNACLPPAGTATNAAVVRLEPILTALGDGAERLRASPQIADAPPAFLIDADRQATHSAPLPDAFDNRSVLFATDFPSATKLAQHGITRAIVVREAAGPIGTDLSHALQIWQQAGVRLEVKRLAEPGPAGLLVLPRLRWWSDLWRRLTGALGLRRNAGGEFGGFIPHPSGG